MHLREDMERYLREGKKLMGQLTPIVSLSGDLCSFKGSSSSSSCGDLTS